MSSPGNRNGRPTLVSLLTVAGLIIVWWGVGAAGLVSPLFLPPPTAVLARFIDVATVGYVDATLAQHTVQSLARVFAALAASVAVAVPIGVIIGLSPLGRGILDPLVEGLRPLPPLAYLPLIIIWAGIGEASKVLVIAIAMLPPIALATAAGVRGVSPDRVAAARTLGASRGQVIRLVVLPSALPAILTGVRIGLGVGWSTLVAAELVAATRGLGFMIQSAAQFLNTDIVIMGILVIAAVAFVLEGAVRLIERLLVPWRGRD